MLVLVKGYNRVVVGEVRRYDSKVISEMVRYCVQTTVRPEVSFNTHVPETNLKLHTQIRRSPERNASHQL
jgi:hypothetical protein